MNRSKTKHDHIKHEDNGHCYGLINKSKNEQKGKRIIEPNIKNEITTNRDSLNLFRATASS